MTEYLYRAWAWVDYSTPLFNEDGDLLTFETIEPKIKILYDELPVIRRTRCGVWVETEGGAEKWVALSGRKRYAYPTKEEALVSLHIRQIHRREHLRRALKKVQDVLEYLDKERGTDYA